MTSRPWTPPIVIAKRAAGRTLRAAQAGVVTLANGQRPTLVDAVCARYLGQRDRREVAGLWLHYGPQILAAAPGWADTTRSAKGVDEDLDRRVTSRS